jgi:hypothetical protein
MYVTNGIPLGRPLLTVATINHVETQKAMKPACNTDHEPCHSNTKGDETCMRNAMWGGSQNTNGMFTESSYGKVSNLATASCTPP